MRSQDLKLRSSVFESLGEITVAPGDNRVVVGDFSINEGDDTIWVEIQRISGDQGWPWSYGILRWSTGFGDELGSVKAYANQAGEVYRLGVGLTPRALTGQIIYEPRSFNLAWIKKGYELTLSFAARSGVTSGAGVTQGAVSIAHPVVDGLWVYSNGLVNLRL